MASVLLLGAITSCKDDSIETVPEWETGVHGLAGFASGSAQNFVFQDPSVELNLTFQWISIDSENKVNRIELYVLFNEPYTDVDGNPATASHGGDDGVLIDVIEGDQVASNRTEMAFTFSQFDIYELYKDATFNYDKNDNTAETPVFSNPDTPDRTTESPFIKGDEFQLKWIFTTEDGRVFDKWGVSVCTEFPGANCQLDWGVICTSDLAGTYDVVSTFVSPGYFTSENPDFQYGPGNDGSVANGVQTYNNIVVEEGDATATYIIPDITNGFEPIMWGNVPVKAIVADQCGTLVLSSLVTSPYAYEILSGSKVNTDGSLTIKWENVYGEYGESTFTPQ